MTDIEAALATWLLAQGSITALIGDRLYPLVIPQDAALPAVAYQTIGRPRMRAHGQRARMARTLVQLTVQARGYATAHETAGVIIAALDGRRGEMGGMTVISMVENDPDSLSSADLESVIRVDVRLIHPV